MHLSIPVTALIYIISSFAAANKTKKGMLRRGTYTNRRHMPAFPKMVLQNLQDALMSFKP